MTFLRELFKTIQVLAACQAEIGNLCDFQPLFSTGRESQPRGAPIPTRFATAQRSNNRTPTNRRGALSSCHAQIHLQWLGFGVRPALTSRLIDRNQTLGLRSVVPLASSSPVVSRSFPILTRPKPPNHAEVRSSTSLAYSEYRISMQQATAVNRIQQLRAQPQPRSEYQPPLVPTTRELWRSCGTPKLRWLPQNDLHGLHRKRSTLHNIVGLFS